MAGVGQHRVEGAVAPGGRQRVVVEDLVVMVLAMAMAVTVVVVVALLGVVGQEAGAELAVRRDDVRAAGLER